MMAPTPTQGRARLISVDATRGLAVLGLMTAHILVFSRPLSLTGNPTESLPATGANGVFLWIINVLCVGKFMFLFALLFGAGVIFFDEKSPDGPLRRGAGLWYRRMAWLAAIGLVHGLVLFFGDILLLYAICGMGGLWWMRRLRPWLLITIGSSIFVLVSLALAGLMLLIINVTDSFAPTSGEEAASAGADFGTALFGSLLTPERQMELNQGSFLDAAKLRLALLANTWINIPFFSFWAASSIMLIGMGLARNGVLTGRRSTRFYVAMLAIGVLVGVPASAAGFAWVMESPEVRSLIWVAVFQLLGVPLAFAYLALVVLMGRLPAVRPVEAVLAAVGRMALSNYVLHSLLGVLIFHSWGGIGRGWFGTMEFPALAWIVLLVWATNIAFSLLWLRAFRFGPLEWVWRSLTYWKRQPMLRRG